MELTKLFTRNFGDLPVWVWGIIIVAGAGIAFFVPKLLGGGAASTTDQTGTDQSGTTTDQSGLALGPVDPQTGIPYSLEAMQAQNPFIGGSGGTTGGGSGVTAANSSGGDLSAQNNLQNNGATPTNNSGGNIPGARYYTVPNYPANDPRYGWYHLSLALHVPLQKLIALNPNVPGSGQGGHGAAHAGEVIRVA